MKKYPDTGCMAKNMHYPSIMVRAVKQNRLKRIVRCKKIHRLKPGQLLLPALPEGIGLATAHLMHEAGWHIVRVDWDEEALTESAKDFEERFGAGM